jgi:hypothetical protein
MLGQQDEDEEEDHPTAAGDNNNEDINLSTKMKLRHYVNTLRDQRIYT